ncbi:hypothetical protein MKZ20_07810 [Psychrobacillus sp. FSL K6-2684]|uniref:Uncharacterized protein n=1 Tax=Psychrobacillus faecigallinarum TaxID=2762235 RepID=A0ABR8R435_9BACI|nr:MULTISPECIES: hypothetical protein [Psychrobacillus]MBD7942545.1 hypothetical protein [Psychrobacillus faecigallinarum]
MINMEKYRSRMLVEIAELQKIIHEVIDSIEVVKISRRLAHKILKLL